MTTAQNTNNHSLSIKNTKRRKSSSAINQLTALSSLFRFKSGYFQALHNDEVQDTYDLAAWRELEKRPIQKTDNETVKHLINAASRRESLTLYYHGGSDTGRLRRFSPEQVFYAEHSTIAYVNGHCHLRGERRTLKIDHISLD